MANLRVCPICMSPSCKLVKREIFGVIYPVCCSCNKKSNEYLKEELMKNPIINNDSWKHE